MPAGNWSLTSVYLLQGRWLYRAHVSQECSRWQTSDMGKEVAVLCFVVWTLRASLPSSFDSNWLQSVYDT